MLPAMLISPTNLFAAAGGIAAAIAIGGFAGQAIAILRSVSEARRRAETAVGGLAALIAIIGLILYSKIGG
ncbi:MAG TPA: hypothetical protein VJL81_13320 [Solirubrobacterales bacterium]|nr:hypothetical protein [Solirubrobacterales bacterium]